MHHLIKYTGYILWVGMLLASSGCIQRDKEEWVDLFNGKDLSGWKANENPESFRVEDGVIVANGDRSHLYYVGDVNGANFKNFELQVDVMTHSLANSGIYFHTQYQDEGWPLVGYEVQINNTHIGGGDYREVKKTGSLYVVKNVYKAFAQDSVWFTMNIRVQGKHIQVKVNDKLVVDYVEPETPWRSEEHKGRILSEGTFALQGHDPDSKVLFKNIRIKVLDDKADQPVDKAELYQEIVELQSSHFPIIDMDVSAEYEQVDSLIQSFYQSGVNLALTAALTDQDADVNAKLSSLISSYNHYPVFFGVKINDPTVLEMVHADVLNTIDFVSLEFPLEGLSAPLVDIDAFMDQHVSAMTLSLMEAPVDVLVDPLALPALLESRRNTLWTEGRMLQIIQAAKERGMAIQINCRERTPHTSFISLAKANGCKIVFADFYDETGSLDISYAQEVIQQSQLDYKDIYIPDKQIEAFLKTQN